MKLKWLTAAALAAFTSAAYAQSSVTLYGVVDSKADKDMAYIRANGVPGVFSVKNYLQVAGQPSESGKPQ